MKKSTRLLSVVISVALVMSLSLNVFAAKPTFNAPTSPMTIDENVITMAAHSQGWITPEVLGINNTTARDQEIPEYYANEKATLDNASKTVAVGVFGSDINESPNPFIYNYFYNVYARENGLEELPLGQFMMSKDVTGGPMTAAAAGGYDQDGQVVCASLYLRPDILLGVDPVEGETTGYSEALAALPENSDEDTANDYEPYQVVYTTEHVYSFLQSMYELSDVCNEITAETGKTTRYGDPLTITSDVEKFVKGTQAYVIGQIAENGDELKTVAVLDASATDYMRSAGVIAEDEYVLNTKDISTQSTTTYSRVAEFVADTSINLVDALGLPQQESTQVAADTGRGAKESVYYKATADQIAENCDVVLFCNVLSSVPENTNEGFSEGSFLTDLVEKASAELKDKAREVEVLGAAFACVGSLGANSVENLLGMSYYTAYLYPQYVNQFDIIAYWMQNFYHISDLSTLKSVISTICADSSVLSDYEETYTADISSYSAEAVEEIVVEGMKYYATHEADFADTLLYQNGRTGEMTGWEIDWTSGLGAGQEPSAEANEGTAASPETEGTAAAATSGSPVVIIVVAVIIVAAVLVFMKKKGKKA